MRFGRLAMVVGLPCVLACHAAPVASPITEPASASAPSNERATPRPDPIDDAAAPPTSERTFQWPTGTQAAGPRAEHDTSFSAEEIERVRRVCYSPSSSAEAGTACQALAALHAEGMGGFVRDPAQATQLVERATQHYRRACYAADTRACGMLGILWAMKLRSLDPASPAAKEWASATIPLLERACRGGDRFACGDLVDIYEVGRGVGRDPVKATLHRAQERALPERATP